MHRLTILYGRPTDPDAFDDYYLSVHLPIARRMTGLADWKLTWMTEQSGDLAEPIHLVVELYAESREAMDAILASPEGQAAADDVANFATGGATFLQGTERTVEL